MREPEQAIKRSWWTGLCRDNGLIELEAASYWPPSEPEPVIRTREANGILSATFDKLLNTPLAERSHALRHSFPPALRQAQTGKPNPSTSWTQRPDVEAPLIVWDYVFALEYRVDRVTAKLERLRRDFEMLARWADEQNAGNAFAEQLGHMARARLEEWELPVERWEP